MERQVNRRRMVALCYVTCAALLTVFYAVDQDWAGKWVILTALLAASAGVVSGFVWLGQVTKEYAIESGGREMADERQIRVRDAAYRTAYLVFSGAILTGILYANVATSKKLAPYLWLPGNETEWRVILGAVVFLGASLPQAIIAWREPDMPEEA